jgi:hypothetical protein
MAERGSSGRAGEAATASSGRRRERAPQNLAGAVQRIGRDELQGIADDLRALWRGDASVAERTAARLSGLLRELGLVTRDELEEMELRIAQLEHRLRLLEDGRPPS